MNNYILKIIKKEAFITPHPQLKPNYGKAFTLAEVLTTLMVIGVVAALTIPNLMQIFQEQLLNKQKTVFSKKFEEGLRQMRIDEKLNTQYASTEDFVNEMKKYFKITQICDSNNLKNCFTQKFSAVSYLNGNSTNNKIFDITQIKKTKDLSENATFESDVIGMKFADGASVLISYKPNCIGIESGNTTGNHYECFGYVADINSSKTPNSTGKDIISNMILSNNFGLSFNIADVGYNMNWEESEKYCEEKGLNLPTRLQLIEIAQKIYVESGACPENITNADNLKDLNVCESDIVFSHPLWVTLSNNISSFCLWGNEPSIYDGQPCSFGRRYRDKGTDSIYALQNNLYNSVCVE